MICVFTLEETDPVLFDLILMSNSTKKITLFYTQMSQDQIQKKPVTKKQTSRLKIKTFKLLKAQTEPKTMNCKR